MISTLISIQDIRTKNRWDFPSHAPEYQHILELIKRSRWNHCKLETVVERFEYGMALRSDYAESGVPFLRIKNIREPQIDLSNISFVPKKVDGLEKYMLEAGDVVVIRSGANLGTAAVIPEELSGLLNKFLDGLDRLLLNRT